MTDFDYILSQAAHGNRKAQKKLFDDYSPALMGTALRYVKHKSDAQDVLQEVFIRIFKNLITTDFKNQQNLMAWMKKITINEALRWIKRNKKHHHEILDLVVHRIPTGKEEKEEIDCRLLSIISSLPEGYRVVFNMAVIDGFSHKEIGETLGIKESASRSQLSRARNLLQRLLAKSEYYARVK